MCDGKILEINGETTALYALIQNKFGGDPRKDICSAQFTRA
jgi:microcystin-dependent protein